MDGGNYADNGWCPPNLSIHEREYLGWQVPEDLTEAKVVTDMPSYINHSVDFAKSKVAEMNGSAVVLGDGSTVIRQFPEAGDIFTTGQHVFLLTDTQTFLMPDMTGWTRKDVAGLWSATGFGFQLSGTGKVVSQSIPPGTAVSKGTEITVVFE